MKRISAAPPQVALAPERVVSARDAVAAVGFAETLGEANVRVGTDLHKRVLKDWLSGGGAGGGGGGGLDAETPRLCAALRRALAHEIGTRGSGGEPGGGGGADHPDLFSLVRRVSSSHLRRGRALR